MFNNLLWLAISLSLLHGVSVLGQTQYPIWSATPFGQCVSDPLKPKKGIAHRTVNCIAAFTGLALSAGACPSATRPCATKKCSCKRQKCAAPQASPVVLAKNCLAKEKGSWKRNPPVESIGYLPVSAAFHQVDNHIYMGHQGRPLTCGAACVNGAVACHGGFPFFRKTDKKLNSAKKCAFFCVSVGLDLSGFSKQDKVCRCGATLSNAVVYSSNPRHCLQLNTADLTQTSQGVDVEVYRYAGFLYADGIPNKLARLANDIENRYIDAVVSGNATVVKPAEPIFAQAVQPVKPVNTASWQRRCYPYPNTCAVHGPAQGITGYVSSTVPDFDDTPPVHRFDKYVTVRYMFQSGVDATRKEAFREAAANWLDDTCINLVEEGNLNNRSSYELEVQTTTDNTCAATLGTPGVHNGVTTGYIKLGWCNSLRYVGNMMHEIGHILGMLHEQNRPDAINAYHGKGPFLQLNWQNIPTDWRPQWQPHSNSYTGSSFDQVGDVEQGYAPYDFESIMHYYVSADQGSTIPPGIYTGNRNHLSAGDIKQVLDMYQCHYVNGSGGLSVHGGKNATSTNAPISTSPSAPLGVINHAVWHGVTSLRIVLYALFGLCMPSFLSAP